MTDMLVKLYDLPPLQPDLERQASQGITIRRGMAPEKHLVLPWIVEHFSHYWRSETDVAFSRMPVSCFLAHQGDTLLGFACYDTTRRGFFGPIGVHDRARGKGTGRALLLACLHDMWDQGYGYAIIGWIGPDEFYAKAVGATIIPDSTPGVYAGVLGIET